MNPHAYQTSLNVYVQGHIFNVQLSPDKNTKRQDQDLIEITYC